MMGNVLAENVTIKIRIDDAEVRAQLARARAEGGTLVAGSAASRLTVAPGGLAMTMPMTGGARPGAGAAAAQAAVALEGGRTLTTRARQPRANIATEPASAAAEMAAALAAVVQKTTPTGRLTNQEIAEIYERRLAAGRPLDPPMTNLEIAEQFERRGLKVGGPGSPSFPTMPLPAYIAVKPQLPLTLTPAAKGQTGAALAAAGRLGFSGGGGRLLRAFVSPRVATGAGLAALFASTREHASYRANYFRELFANPASTPEWKPLNAVVHSWRTTAAKASSAVVGAAGSLVYDTMAFFGDLALAAFGVDDNQRRAWGLAFDLAQQDYRDFFGLDKAKYRAAQHSRNKREAAYSQLKLEQDRAVTEFAEAAAKRLSKVGVGLSQFQLQTVFTGDAAFREKFLSDEERKFLRDYTQSVHVRQLDPLWRLRQ